MEKTRKPYKRKTHAERAAEGKVEPQLLTTDEAAIFLGVDAGTLRNLVKETPKKWSWEAFKKALESGRIVGPPYLKMGGDTRYNRNALITYIAFLPAWGQLPKEENETSVKQ